MCNFCNLYPESAEHLLFNCSKSQIVWNIISANTGISFHFSDGFVSGNWLSNARYSMKNKVTIALAAWFLWKARCDAIFRNSRPNFAAIAHKTLSFANTNLCAFRNPLCRKLILSNYTSSDGLFLFSASSWNEATQVGSGGFFVSSFSYNIFLAGSLPISAETHAEAELITLAAALNSVINSHLQIRNLFVSKSSASAFTFSRDAACSWRLHPHIDNVMRLLIEANSPQFNSIPLDWLHVAFKLAKYGHNLHALSLFHSGRELPLWLMKIFTNAGLVFV
ncbi:hypothetical protein IHE45_17G121300 [Dioscorea alata]|uniref:Uncharacterized protein n=1 Tax=Dioscorea alata TaxID=55571 RepID=A0ACB7UFA4_DIOAL|nr:hypothetical protein IHE45_17G121300 [Dioscorea alata]